MTTFVEQKPRHVGRLFLDFGGRFMLYEQYYINHPQAVHLLQVGLGLAPHALARKSVVSGQCKHAAVRLMRPAKFVPAAKKRGARLPGPEDGLPDADWPPAPSGRLPP
jgi:hypothetical protein